MKNIRPGDRVSAELENHVTLPVNSIKSIKGEFIEIKSNGMAAIRDDNGSTWFFVPKSMRKLVKKQREEIWVNRYAGIERFFTTHKTKREADDHAARNNANTWGRENRSECVRFIKAKRQE